MIPDDIREIVSALLERSKKREVNWVEANQLGLGEGDDYFLSLPNSSINIWRAEPPDDPPFIAGNILNSQGKVAVYFDSKGNREDAVLLEELLAWAKRSALQADETIDDIKRALASKNPIGDPNPKKKDDIPF